MAAAVRMPSANQPKSMTRPTRWSDVVEEAYRFQIAGYRDEIEYREVQKTDHVSSAFNFFKSLDAFWDLFSFQWGYITPKPY